MNIILFVLAVEVAIRFLPLLDSLAELLNHCIAIGFQKCDSKIRKIAQEEEAPKPQSFNVKGFVADEISIQRDENFDKA